MPAAPAPSTATCVFRHVLLLATSRVLRGVAAANERPKEATKNLSMVGDMLHRDQGSELIRNEGIERMSKDRS